MVFRFLFLFVLLFKTFAYPEIGALDEKDLLFRQLTEDVKQYYKGTFSKGTVPGLKIFTYTPGDDETLFSCAARCNISYETIATLNRFSNPDDFSGPLLIPNQPGIFLPETDLSDLEQIMGAYREGLEIPGQKVLIHQNSKKTAFLFFSGQKFHSTERAFFLKIFFRYPLARKWGLTSSFGIRPNPFTGHKEFHSGIDIGAPPGTEVLAAGKGTVLSTGFDKVYGNYIILSHTGGFYSVYGHLSKINVKEKQLVNSGTFIGEVGTTGYSTGPHLHFEIKKEGNPRDPMSVLY